MTVKNIIRNDNVVSFDCSECGQGLEMMIGIPGKDSVVCECGEVYDLVYSEVAVRSYTGGQADEVSA